MSAPARDAPWTAVAVSGVLRQYLPRPDGRQVTIRYARAGDLVGSSSWGNSWLRAEVEAVEPSNLLHLDVPRLERVARLEPALSMALTDELAHLLSDTYETLAGTAFATVRARVARDLLERAGNAQSMKPGTRVRVAQQALANATGSVREVVARALRQLRLRGVIETNQSGVTILKVDALIAEAANARSASDTPRSVTSSEEVTAVTTGHSK